MEMKIAPIALIMYLAIRDFFFFFFSSSSKIPLSNISQHSIFQILNYAKPSNLFIFFTFHVLLVAVLAGISSQLSKSFSSSNAQLSISSSFIDSYVDYEEEKPREIESYNDGFNLYSKINDLINFKEEIYGLPYVYDYVLRDDFIPGSILHVECKEEKVEGREILSHYEDRKKEENTILNTVLMNDSGENYEIVICDDYVYEDTMKMNEEGNYSDLDDVDFNPSMMMNEEDSYSDLENSRVY